MTRKGIEYDRRHRAQFRREGKANQFFCVDCNRRAADWSQIHDTDGLSSDDYDPRCRSCHKLYDMTDDVRENISIARSLTKSWPICRWGHDRRLPGNTMKSGRCAECNREIKRAMRLGISRKEMLGVSQ